MMEIVAIDNEHQQTRLKNFKKVLIVDAKVATRTKHVKKSRNSFYEKLYVKMVKTEEATVTAVNLCESPKIINHTYKDMGHQLIILDIGAQVSIAGV